MSSLRHDARYAVRSLARSPGWTLAAVLTPALGVAANTTVFSWVRSVLLRPIPGAADTGRLRVVYARTPSGEPARISAREADRKRKTRFTAILDIRRGRSPGVRTSTPQRWARRTN